MSEFGRRARPDERTVQKVAKGEVKVRESPPRKPRKRPAKAPDITSVKVDPRVWETALGLASSPRNIEIRSEVEVVVHNHPPPWLRP